MAKKEDIMNQDRITIRIASPDTIRAWSNGFVKKAETLNYRTLKPEKDGLFCERIFGPVRDWECNCGKYKGIKFRGITCDRCGVTISRSSVRRENMGHIDLACPVTHIWFYKAVPSRLAALLQITLKDLEKLIYYEEYVVIDPGDTPLKKKEFLTEDKYQEAVTKSRLRPNFNFENYAVSTSNQMAWAAADAVSKNPGSAYNPLFIWGGVGFGKRDVIHV